MRQSPYRLNSKRKSFDENDLAYRSTPEYLRQLMNNSLNSSRSPSKNLGNNQKYKTQEDYYDEIQLLKKELKICKDDNNNLRIKVRRLEEENVRKHRELESDFQSSSSTNVLLNLKQRIFKLETQLKQKDTTIEEMKCDPRWTKSFELIQQNRILLNEIEKQKLEKTNFIQNNYMATIEEEKKNAIRKLEFDKQELKIENENLKKKLDDKNAKPNEKIHQLKLLCQQYENDLEQIKNEYKQIRREKAKYRDKYEYIREEFDMIKRKYEKLKENFSRLNDEFERLQSKESIRSRRSTHNRYEMNEKHHAARVIQRSWRKYQRIKSSNDFNRRSMKTRESALKIVQAVLRGHIQRTAIGQSPNNFNETNKIHFNSRFDREFSTHKFYQSVVSDYRSPRQSNISLRKIQNNDVI